MIAYTCKANNSKLKFEYFWRFLRSEPTRIRCMPYSYCPPDYERDTTIYYYDQRTVKRIGYSCCRERDTSYPSLDENTSVVYEWKRPQDRTQECRDINGSVETKKQDCQTIFGCIVKEPNLPKCDDNQTLDRTFEPPICVPKCDDNKTLDRNAVPPVCVDNPPQCDQNDTAFPTKADNQEIIDVWYEPEDRSAQCTANKGTVQERLVSCKKMYRCIKRTDNSCPIEKDESISSYVSPHNDTFHEDIELPGTNFTLHYASANLDDTTIAHGWSLSNYARLEGNRLYYGSGAIRIVDTSVKENTLTVIALGNTELLFDTEGKLQSIRDLYTKETQTTFGYDAMGRLITITDIYGEITTLERNTSSTVTAVVAPTGQRTLLNIDDNGDLIEVQYEDTSSYTFEYEHHLMTVETEPKGNRFLHFYDEAGHVVKVIDAEQGEWRFGTTTADTYGSHTIIRASGDTIVYKNHFLENNTTLKTEKILPTGDTVLYENSIDDSMSSTTSCGMKTTNIYKKNADGTLYKDPYTHRRVLESSTVTTPSGLRQTTLFATAYTLDENRTLVSIEKRTQRNGKTFTLFKDYSQQTQTITTPEGRVNMVYYNRYMQPVTLQYTNLKPIFYSYDDKGRVVQSKQGHRVVRYTYNEQGNLSTRYDVQQDTTTAYTYDSKNRLIHITHSDGSTEDFAYDSNGNLLTRVVPTSAEHTFGYNSVNRPTSYTSPLQKETVYTYDKQRRVIKVTKPSGNTIETTYANGRVTKVTTPESTTSYSYTYQNNPDTITKGNEKIAYSYDGTLITRITLSGTLSQTVTYRYNNDFQIISSSYAGKTENYRYDNDGVLVQSGNYTLTRDPENGLLKRVSNAEMVVTYAYNGFGEIKKQKDALFGYSLKRKKAHIAKKREYVVHAKKRKNGKIKKIKKRTTYQYTYDKRGRLIEVKRNKHTVERYSYDSNGNRKSATVYGKTTTAHYTLDDQLQVYGDNTYRYDDDGYLIEKTTPEGTTTYGYNTLGALTDVTLPDGTTIHYITDPLNRRIAKEVNGTIVEKYLWEDLTTLLAIYDSNNNLIRRFEYADGRMPISMTDESGNRYYLHYDQVGSLRAVSDASGNVVKEIVYDTFGNILSDSAPSFRVPFGFAGGLYDLDTKLTHFGFREYDAYTGKWTSKDPIGFQGGDSNLYGYVLNDPVNLVDPWGLCSVWEWITSTGECLRDKLGTKVDYDFLRGQYCSGGYGAALYYCSTLSPYANAECRAALDRYNTGLDDPKCGDNECKTK